MRVKIIKTLGIPALSGIKTLKIELALQEIVAKALSKITTIIKFKYKVI
jgi:hypothetical protein